jgi:hypothetical protein
MSATTQVLKQLQLLQRLIQKDEEQDEVVEVTVAKLVSYELNKLKERQSQIGKRLATFEERYGLTTEEFQQKFRHGTLGDATDFFEWSALADMHEEVTQQLTEAEPTSHASSHSDAAQ